MNLKMSDFLFEKKNVQELEDNTDLEGRLELRSELSDDHIKDGPELLLGELGEVAEKIAAHLFSLSANAVNNAKIRDATKGKNKEELTPDEITAIEKADKILSMPLGVIDTKLLGDLFIKEYSVGYSGKIGGRVHLNPVQLKSGAKQVAGGTSVDLEESKKMQMVFMFLSNENSNIVKCKGKAVVFAIPALGANCTNGLDFYTQLYPGVTKEAPIIYDISKVSFFLLPFDEFDKFQTSKLNTITRCIQKEKSEVQEESGETNESFIYRQGLCILI